MRAKIRLDTSSAVRDFVDIAATIPEPITLSDGAGFSVNAKSMLGVLYSMEWHTIYCECTKDIYSKISRFVIVEG